MPRAPIAQLVELRTFNPQVVGSSPTGGTSRKPSPHEAFVGQRQPRRVPPALSKSSVRLLVKQGRPRPSSHLLPKRIATTRMTRGVGWMLGAAAGHRGGLEQLCRNAPTTEATAPAPTSTSAPHPPTPAAWKLRARTPPPRRGSRSGAPPPGGPTSAWSPSPPSATRGS